ncbi:hypothetical protein [Rhodoluna sp. KAS3]|jgi:hypothetical protein|uniref:hypothetical protein n=1 Tax=Rhodoluna sp. KAS3 TaxID=942880 RepID=UPI00222F5D4E|nr:hypothetical protein [Rhodoluna sp. KAS3]BDS49451.1 hypothetical protein RKAS3_10280 [Rhodoluna sp. KAS3]
MIKWDSLLLVAGVAIGASVFITAAFSLGMRWLTNARHILETTEKSPSLEVRDSTNPLEVVFRIGAYVMFTICAASVLYGIYLIVPYFHMG